MEDDDSECEILTNLVEIILTRYDLRLTCDKKVNHVYIDTDIDLILPDDILIEINGTAVRTQKHAEELLLAAKYETQDLVLRLIRNSCLIDSSLLATFHKICDERFLNGSYNIALNAANRALTLTISHITQRSGLKDAVSKCYEKLGRIYRKLGNPYNSIKSYKLALTILEQLHGIESVHLAEVLEVLINLYRKERRIDKSFLLCQRLLKILQKNDLNSTDKRIIGNTHHNIAFVYRARLELDKAESAATHAMELRAIQLGNNHPDVAQSLNFLASVSNRCIHNSTSIQ